MSLDDAQKRLLRGVARRRTRAQLKALFAAIRSNDERALFAALVQTKDKPKRASDPLVRALEQALKPVLARGAEKAEMLVEHLAQTHRCQLGFQAKGLADAARRLRAAKFSDAQIRAGAESLVAHLSKLHGRETVV